MLKEPRSEDIGRHLWKNASFLLVFLAIGIVVLFPRPFAAANAGVTRIACHQHAREQTNINSKLSPFTTLTLIYIKIHYYAAKQNKTKNYSKLLNILKTYLRH